MTEEAAAALGRPVSDTRITLAQWRSGPGAGLDRAGPRTTSPPCSAAYDEGGLVGDPSVLAGLLGREPTTWMTWVSQCAGIAGGELGGPGQ